MNDCYDFFYFHPEAENLILALQKSKSDSEKILMNRIIKVMIEKNHRDIFDAFCFHTVLSPCDSCSKALQAFANFMEVPVYVTFNLGYYEERNFERMYHVRANNHDTFNIPFEVGTRMSSIGNEAQKSPRILSYLPAIHVHN